METHHTRVPLWRGEPENIVGVISTKLLAQALVEHRGDLSSVAPTGNGAGSSRRRSPR